MSRPTRAAIDLSALRANLKRIRAVAPDSRIMAVIKANAYGHGIEPAARALVGADAFAVACMDEAMQVRAAGLGQPIVLLEGVFSALELAGAVSHHFEVVVHDSGQLDRVCSLDADAALKVWLKIDTGMSRLGFPLDEARAAWERLQTAPGVCKPVGLMTHLACADEDPDTRTVGQLKQFDEVTRGLPGLRSVANSAGVLRWPEAHADWARPGIILYGVSPLPARSGPDEGLRPAMTVSTQLISVRELDRGDSVGYGATWTAPEPMRIGVAAIGYGDGYPRHAPNGTPVLVNDARCALVGRVSMDMITVDLRACPQAQAGDRVVLWGQGLPVEEIAAAAGTIPYELLCGVTQRVKVELVDDGAPDPALEFRTRSSPS